MPMSFAFTRWLRYCPFLVPPLYLVIILWFQPGDRLGDSPGGWPEERLLYDDYDVTAFALRGLNAARGRTPGAGYPYPLATRAFELSLDSPPPLEPHYFLEYPPAMLLLFRLGWLGQPAVSDPAVPTPVLDGWHNNLVEHWPRTEAEQDLWRQFRRAIQVHLALMTLCLLGLMALLDRGYDFDGQLSGPSWLLILPAALYFALNRADLAPVLLVAVSLACLGRRWLAASAFFLGAATMLKAYPVLLAPLVFRYLSSEWRIALKWSAVYAGTLAIFIVPPVLTWGWEAAWAPMQFQLSRPLEPAWTFYGLVLPEWLGAEPAGRLRLGAVLLVEAALFLRRPTELAGLLRRGALVLLVFVALQVFFSPQWLLWFAPLLIPLARNDRILLVLLIALDLLTYCSFPWVYDWQDVAAREAWRPLLVWLRFGLLAALVGLLAFREYRNERMELSDV